MIRNSSKWTTLLFTNWWLVVLVAFAVFLPLIMSPYTLLLAGYILIAALFAQSFNLMFGFMGKLSFGHAGYFGVGAYTVALLATRTNIPLFFSIPAAILVTGIIAFIIGFFCVRRSGYYFAILTMAFSQLLFVIVYKWYKFTHGDDGIHGIPVPAFLDSSVAQYYFVLALCGFAIAILWRITYSPFGYILRCMRDNPVRTEFNGINLTRYQLIAFVIAALFAGFAGALFTVFNRAVTPGLLDWTRSADPVIMTVIGGQFTFFGPFIGAIIFLFLQSFILQYTIFWPIIIGCILLLVVLFVPGGVVGTLQQFFESFKNKRVAKITDPDINKK